jgi:hypothetical protein
MKERKKVLTERNNRSSDAGSSDDSEIDLTTKPSKKKSDKHRKNHVETDEPAAGILQMAKGTKISIVADNGATMARGVLEDGEPLFPGQYLSLSLSITHTNKHTHTHPRPHTFRHVIPFIFRHHVLHSDADEDGLSRKEVEHFDYIKTHALGSFQLVTMESICKGWGDTEIPMDQVYTKEWGKIRKKGKRTLKRIMDRREMVHLWHESIAPAEKKKSQSKNNKTSPAKRKQV